MRSAQLALPLARPSPIEQDWRMPFGRQASASDPDKRVGLDRCGSPLEESLALAFSTLRNFRWAEDCEAHCVLGCWPSLRWLLLAQAPFAMFRPDFALVPMGVRTSEFPRLVIVEVDGHAFHEKTAEQVQRDRARDRYIVESGATLLRFTGREVWRGARRCALEVTTYLERLNAGPLAEAG